MSADHKAAYIIGYQYLRSLVDPLDDEQVLLTCPQCPEWLLKDVLAHLMSVVELTATNKRPGWLRQRVLDSIVNSDPVEREAAGRDRDRFWNDLGVSLRPLTVAELFDRWEAAMDRLREDQWSVVDFAVHVGDVEEALGAAGSRQMEMHGLSLERYSQLMVGHLQATGVPTVSLRGTEPDLSTGDKSSSHCVEGPTYEILRAVTGRRSMAEARELLDWTTTPDETRAVFPIYDWLPQSLREVTVL